MTPIRLAFIGLSKVGWAPKAHLPYILSSPDYEIVAICNSSIESAKEAIQLYKLPGSVKAYGDPEELAKDPSIDLVICTIRVDRHLAAISPSLHAGKDVYVEWPLGKNLTEAKELLRLKNEGGVKNAIVGLQGRQSPFIKKIKVLVDEERVGKVLSSTWMGQAGHLGGSTPEGMGILASRKEGGNLVSIHFGHAVDYIQCVFGYGFETPPKTLLASRRKFTKLIDSKGTVVDEKYPITADDTIFLHGTLSSGIPLSMSLRGGKPFKGTPGLDWRIYGEKGEIRVTAGGPSLQVGYPDMKIQVFDFEKDEVEDVQVEKDEFDGTFALPVGNVARVYRSLVEGEMNCSFEDAVERHKLIDEIYRENGIQFKE